ncbi:MAG: nitrous oxide reductase family maturation protein NosD, partial [Gemmatimonadaceae bacterium]
RSGPRPIAYGRDVCAYCLMQINDARYAAELVTHTGKVYTFDSIECLVSYYQTLDAAHRGAVESLWVSDYAHPGTLIAATSAAYLRAAGPGSPMGRGMMAAADSVSLTPLRPQAADTIMTWSDVLALAQREHWSTHDPAPIAASPVGAHHALVVGQGIESAYHYLADAVRAARPGDTIVVQAGTYREPTIVVDRPVSIVGIGRPTLDGQGSRQIMTVAADDVSIQGLRFAHVGTSYVEDRAAIKVLKARRCAIVDNEIDDAFFGIYVAKSSDCRIERNEIRGLARTETSSGKGIHLWASNHVLVADNVISGQRDGIYLEFSRDDEVRGNTSEHNLRYGLHFMFSDSCRYVDNTFRRNGAGVAVMYTHGVTMTGNRFEDNWGSAAYGLLLKEIVDSRVERNLFLRNTTGIVIDGANRLVADHNDFVDNGWALKLDGSTQDGRVSANNFTGNTFDVSTTGHVLSTTINGNYWDRYDGYDLNRDGVGDVPFRPVRLFAVIVARNEPALILLRSSFVDLIDIGERVIPALTPPAFADSAPRMRPVR